MDTPTLVAQLLRQYAARQPAPARPAESASWSAPCPHCRAEADWWSGIVDMQMRHKMHCPSCGDIEWEN